MSSFYNLPLSLYYVKLSQDVFSAFLWAVSVNWAGIKADRFLREPLRVKFTKSLRAASRRSFFATQLSRQLKYHSKYFYFRKAHVNQHSLSQRLSNLRYTTPVTSLWTENYLAQLKSIEVLGLKSNSYKRTLLTPLSSEVKSFSPSVNRNSLPSVRSRRFSKTSLTSTKVQKLKEYLSLKRVKLSIKTLATPSPSLQSPVRAFTPRPQRQPRSKIPNPYLFLKLHHSYKPKKISIFDRFIASIGKLSLTKRVKRNVIVHASGSLSTKQKRKSKIQRPSPIPLRRRLGKKRWKLRFLKRQDVFLQQNASIRKRNNTKLRPQEKLRRTLTDFRPVNSASTSLTLEPQLQSVSGTKLGLGHGILASDNFSRLTPTHKILLRRTPRTLQTPLSAAQRLNLKSTYNYLGLIRSFQALTRKSKYSTLKSLAKRLRNRKFRNSLLRLKVKTLNHRNSTIYKLTRKVLIKGSRIPSTRTGYSPTPLKRLNTASDSTNLNLTTHLSLPKWFYRLPKLFTEVKDSFTSLESLGFTRSPFYFLAYWTATRSAIVNLLGRRVPKFDAHSYVLFPVANNMKTAVFRKLTSQRLLAQSRQPLLKQYAKRFYKKSSLAASALSWDDRVSTSRVLGNYSTSSYRAISDLNLTKALHNFRHRYTRYIKPKRIRFKPGYGRMWRTARVSIREILDIKATYQYRLNSKLQTYYFQNRNQWKLKRSLTLEFVLMGAHYAPDRDAVYTLLGHNSVYLNGSPASNNHIRIFTNDFIQLVVNLKFYIALRWLKSWALVRRNRASKIFYRKYRPAPFNKNIRIVRELPRWFFDLEAAYGDVPRCFEADYFTLSVFVLPVTATKEQFIPTRSYMFDVNVLNMYNWKYIT